MSSKTTTKIKAQQIAKELFLECFDNCKSQSDFLDASEIAYERINAIYKQDKVAVTDEFNQKWIALWMESSKKNMVYPDTLGKIETERKKVFLNADNKKIMRFIEQFPDQPELDKSFTKACEHNNLEILTFLTEKKNCMGHLIYDDLLVAIENKAYDVLEYMIKDEADININDGQAFYKACRTKDEQMKRMVLDYGYDLEKCPDSVSDEDFEWAQGYVNSKKLHESLDATLKSGNNQKKIKI